MFIFALEAKLEGTIKVNEIRRTTTQVKILFIGFIVLIPVISFKIVAGLLQSQYNAYAFYKSRGIVGSGKFLKQKRSALVK